MQSQGITKSHQDSSSRNDESFITIRPTYFSLSGRSTDYPQSNICFLKIYVFGRNERASSRVSLIGFVLFMGPDNNEKDLEEHLPYLLTVGSKFVWDED